MFSEKHPVNSGTVPAEGIANSVGQLTDEVTHSSLQLFTLHDTGCHICPEIGPVLLTAKNGIHPHADIIAAQVTEIGFQFALQVFALVFQIMDGPVKGMNVADWSAHGINIDHHPPPLHSQNSG